MKIETAENIVKSVIMELINEDGLEIAKTNVNSDMQLIGGDAALDSMKLVEICLALEVKAEELGFEFDWTSSNAMSKSQSMFRSLGSLANEFSRQSDNSK